MFNTNWYLVCNLTTNTATDLIQIPQVYGTVTGLAEQTDDALASFNEWSTHTDTCFLSIAAAKARGIDEASIDNIVSITQPAVLAWVRSMRDPLLSATDPITLTDRWNALDVVSQNYVTVYRQALRDITSQDLLNITWPFIPKELDFIRTLSTINIERPSQSFLDSLSSPFPTPTLQDLRNNQWLRIKADRDQRTSGGLKLTVSGSDYWFWTDDKTRNQYSILDSFAARNSLSGTTVLDNWKTMTGDFVSFTVDLLHHVMDAGVVNEKVIYNVAESHRQNVMASNDPNSYNYTTGYPQSYQDYVDAQVAAGNTTINKDGET